ncbi:MAG: hypothetical protein MJE77_20570 [Proteobacteria bacterium]|nr:hypothetical protein [Pseudomonadota bacterium]
MDLASRPTGPDMSRDGEEFYRLEPDGTEIDSHVYPDGQWIFFGHAGPHPIKRVRLVLRSKSGVIESIELGFWCPVERMADIPDTGNYDLDCFVLDPGLLCDVELSMSGPALERHGKALLGIKDWNRRATYQVDGRYPAVDLRFYRLDRFAQIDRVEDRVGVGTGPTE